MLAHRAGAVMAAVRVEHALSEHSEIAHGRFSCVECHAMLAVHQTEKRWAPWIRSYKAHAKAKHPWTIATRATSLKPGQRAVADPTCGPRLAEIIATHHHAPDGSWVSSHRECERGDRRPKKCFTSLEEAQAAASHLGRRYHGYECTLGHFHV